jgi:tellurium resistance protein TerD
MSAINLNKGASINLSKDIQGLKRAKVALKWKPAGAKTVTETKEPGFFGKMLGKAAETVQSVSGGSIAAYDLDAAATIRKVSGSQEKVYYGNLKSANREIIHNGDDLGTSSGGAGGEVMLVNLEAMGADVKAVDFDVTIYNGRGKGQLMKHVDASIVISNDETNEVVAEYALHEDFADETGVMLGSLEKSNGEWSFTAVGKGF